MLIYIFNTWRYYKTPNQSLIFTPWYSKTGRVGAKMHGIDLHAASSRVYEDLTTKKVPLIKLPYLEAYRIMQNNALCYIRFLSLRLGDNS